MGEGPTVLVADVGATKCRFALARSGPRGPELFAIRRQEDRDFASFEDALEAYLAGLRAERGVPSLSAAGFAAAGPVSDGRVRLTHRNWVLAPDALAARLGVPVAVDNDFACAARGLPWLATDELRTLQAGAPDPQAPKVVLGAGTGLGVAYLVPADARPLVIAGEGGHVGFSPQSEEQVALWRWLRATRARVEAEDVLCGAGLAAIHAFLLGRAPAPGDAAAATAVQRDAEAGDALACRALDLYCEIYGAVAGDHALAVLARGGVYVAGGIAPRIAGRLGAGGFVRAFNDKGVHAALAREFPVHLVKSERLELLGAAAIALDLHQTARPPGG